MQICLYLNINIANLVERINKSNTVETTIKEAHAGCGLRNRLSVFILNFSIRKLHSIPGVFREIHTSS